MSSYVLKDADIRYNGLDITGILNQVTIEYGAELQDRTTLNSATRQRLAGLLDAKVNCNGFWDDDFDSELFASIGRTANGVVSIAPNNAEIGARGFTMLAQSATYTKSGNVGDMAQVALNFESDSLLVRGKVGQNGSISANGNSGGILLDSAPSGGFIYGSVHVTSLAGTDTPTINFFVDSSSTIDFGVSTNRITFDAMTAIGAQQDFLAGPITDEFWRLRWTVSGTNPVFSVFAVLGISQR